MLWCLLARCWQRYAGVVPFRSAEGAGYSTTIVREHTPHLQYPDRTSPNCGCLLLRSDSFLFEAIFACTIANVSRSMIAGASGSRIHSSFGRSRVTSFFSFLLFSFVILVNRCSHTSPILMGLFT